MGTLNKVFLIGELAWLPELRLNRWNTPFVNIALVTIEKYKGQEKEERHRLVFRFRLAEIVSQYCKKGSLIYIEGSLRTRSWMDSDGNKKTMTEVHVSSLQLLDKKEVRKELPLVKNHTNDFEFEYPKFNLDLK